MTTDMYHYGMMYLALRRELYRDGVEVGEATITMKVTGTCPTETEFDMAINRLLSTACVQPEDEPNAL